MTTCAWHDEVTPIVSTTPFFDPATSHGICLFCAIEQLMQRPRALKRFLLKQGYSRRAITALLRRSENT